MEQVAVVHQQPAAAQHRGARGLAVAAQQALRAWGAGPAANKLLTKQIQAWHKGLLKPADSFPCGGGACPGCPGFCQSRALLAAHALSDAHKFWYAQASRIHTAWTDLQRLQAVQHAALKVLAQRGGGALHQLPRQRQVVGRHRSVAAGGGGRACGQGGAGSCLESCAKE